MPNFQALENLAVVDAALETSQLAPQMTGALLESGSCAKYPLHLRKLDKQYPGKFSVKRKLHAPDWDLERSAAVRPEWCKLWDRFKDTIKPNLVNQLLPLLRTKLNADYSIPSGKNRDTIYDEVRVALWEEEKAKKAPKPSPASTASTATGEGEAVSPEGGTEGGESARTSAAMPEAWDGGPFFLILTERGPLSDWPVPQFSFALGAGANDATDVASDGTKEQDAAKKSAFSRGVARKRAREERASLNTPGGDATTSGPVTHPLAQLPEQERSALLVQRFSVMTQARKDKVGWPISRLPCMATPIHLACILPLNVLPVRVCCTD